MPAPLLPRVLGRVLGGAEKVPGRGREARVPRRCRAEAERPGFGPGSASTACAWRLPPRHSHLMAESGVRQPPPLCRAGGDQVRWRIHTTLETARSWGCDDLLLSTCHLTEVRTGPEVREWPMGLACPPHSHNTATAWGRPGSQTADQTTCLRSPQVTEVRQRTPRCRNGLSCTDSPGLQRQNFGEQTLK